MKTITCRVRDLVGWVQQHWLAVAGGVAVGLSLFVLPAVVEAQAVVATGAWQSSVKKGSEGTWRLAATKSGADIGGDLTVKGPMDFPQGSAYGSLGEAGSIQFGVVYNDVEEATFTGSVQGTAASGTYTSKSGDSGTWNGSFAPLN